MDWLSRKMIPAMLFVAAFACQDPSEQGGEPARDRPGPKVSGSEHPQGPTPAIAPAAPDGCPGTDSLTILLDGDECADSAFHTGGDQPAVIARLTEPEGDTAIVLIDAGVSHGAIENNLRQWYQRQDLPTPGGQDGILRAFLLSHFHTYFGVKALPWEFESGPADSLGEARDRLGDIPVQGPNIADLCSDPAEVVWNPVARRLCADARVTKPGLAPVRYSDGTLSRRAWTVTYPIASEERAELTFQPYESVFVFRTESGYLVYSVCSHAHQPEQETHPDRPFHAVELVQEHIDAGGLAPGPIHTLITGVCGMNQVIMEGDGGKPPPFEEIQERYRSRISAVAERIGLQRVYLSHCARYFVDKVPQAFMEVFGERVQRAVPGSCIPL